MPMYINVWHDLTNDRETLFEQYVSKTIKEAFSQYREEDINGAVYSYTLKIEGQAVEKLYLGDTLSGEDNDVYDYDKFTGHERDDLKSPKDEIEANDNYERLTGHEMEVCPGRV